MVNSHQMFCARGLLFVVEREERGKGILAPSYVRMGAVARQLVSPGHAMT